MYICPSLDERISEIVIFRTYRIVGSIQTIYKDLADTMRRAAGNKSSQGGPLVSSFSLGLVLPLRVARLDLSEVATSILQSRNPVVNCRCSRFELLMNIDFAN